MEHLNNETELSRRTGITDPRRIKLLLEYAHAIFTENEKYNLTGHKTISDIIDNLIIGSLGPVKLLNVPRGTLFADLGTGAGIPGIPIAILHEEAEGTLFDSNQKKVRFINKIAEELGLQNIEGTDIRVEDAGRTEAYRKKFDIVFTRAMSDIYTIAELGSPLLKVGGFIFLFAEYSRIDISEKLINHLLDLGLSEEILQGPDPYEDGIILRKIKHTDEKYPRRMPVIKRMALK